MKTHLKNTITTVLVLLASSLLGASAQAASFDCVKAQSKVENLVCDNPELSKLDDELAATYAKALKVEAIAVPIKKEQKQWLKVRNRCVNDDCLQHSYQSRITAIAQITQSAQGIEALFGKWEAGGRGGIAVYGMMDISKSKITWKGSSPTPRCTVRYELVPEDEAIRFKVDPERLRNLSPFKSYVLAIHGACALKTTHFRLTLPDNLPGYLDINEYIHGTDDTGSYSHFYKR